MEFGALHCRSNRRRLARSAADRIEHALIDRLEDAPLVLEFQLRLLRVHVHIDRPLRHLDAENCKRETHLRHERTVDVVDRFGNGAVLDCAPVDDVGLPCAAAPYHRRL